MAEAESKKTGTAAELLGDWRAAERDAVAARDTAGVAELAASAAEEARVAATETSEAARLSSEAATRAQQSARRTSDAAEITAQAAKGDLTNAREALRVAGEAETAAADRYHEAEREGFPKT